MTYKKLYDKAVWDLEHDKITLGEFEKMIEPLNKEIPKEEQTDGDLISCLNGWNKAYKDILEDIRKTSSAKETDGDLISRDYAIEQIKKAQENGYVFTYDTLIDFVKVLPTIPQVECTEKPCLGKLCAYYTDGDLISRKAVLDCIGMTSLHYDLARRLRKLPTIPQTISKADIVLDILDQKLTEEYDKSSGIEKRTLKMVFEMIGESIVEAEKIEKKQTNSVLKQIKSEIEKEIEESEDDMFNVGMEYTLEIIDKYISGKRG